MAVNAKFLSSLVSNCNFESNAALNHLMGTSTPPAPSTQTPTTTTSSLFDRITPPTPTPTSLGVSTGKSLFERITIPTTTSTISDNTTAAPATPQNLLNPFSNLPQTPPTSQYGTPEAPQLIPSNQFKFPPLPLNPFANLPPTPPSTYWPTPEAPQPPPPTQYQTPQSLPPTFQNPTPPSPSPPSQTPPQPQQQQQQPPTFPSWNNPTLGHLVNNDNNPATQRLRDAYWAQNLQRRLQEYLTAHSKLTQAHYENIPSLQHLHQQSEFLKVSCPCKKCVDYMEGVEPDSAKEVLEKVIKEKMDAYEGVGGDGKHLFWKAPVKVLHVYSVLGIPGESDNGCCLNSGKCREKDGDYWVEEVEEEL